MQGSAWGVGDGGGFLMPSGKSSIFWSESEKLFISCCSFYEQYISFILLLRLIWGPPTNKQWTKDSKTRPETQILV